ncbi:peptidylprolyl isomerase [Parasphingorhabdus cellanae]|uniref:Parvulin-like PPIase n=1 Tax=Parasphingorhabdus cellanae TaxID=2806553 RepID=A0ABX7T191_9SPHN|nr:peptidylprolyl isomerase [Parasphingorhabdus cellanae]QTD54532.1 peptidyl-prolyl cis-trans isomerase [Parasphingorhabdus cellanae]
MSILKKALRDPITHFVLIGLALVAINHVWSSYQGEQGRTITVSAAEIDRLSVLWANTAGRLPTGEDKQQIIDQYVQQEVLVREAERLGLGDDDTIIKRRLAQKMDFLVSGESTADTPSDAELESWFDQNRDQFAAPERRTFVHIYLSPEKHGDAINGVAVSTLKRAQSGTAWRSLGDPFIQKRSYAAIPQSEVTRLFGPDFASAIFKLKTGQWSQPIGSAFGLHLVRIETIDGAAEASFEPIKAEVAAAWKEDQSSKAKQAALQDLMRGYDVVIEDSER